MNEEKAERIERVIKITDMKLLFYCIFEGNICFYCKLEPETKSGNGKFQFTSLAPQSHLHLPAPSSSLGHGTKG